MPDGSIFIQWISCPFAILRRRRNLRFFLPSAMLVFVSGPVPTVENA
jgi:hypothetical protein